ncbi:MAG: hypothetical protein PWQ52_1, partial [Methanolobus sp.]|nr:hypothetical protein [Methanolobus sp.]
MKESGKRVVFNTEKSSIIGVDSDRKKRQDVAPIALANTRSPIWRPPVLRLNLCPSNSIPIISLPVVENKAMTTAVTRTKPAGTVRSFRYAFAG